MYRSEGKVGFSQVDENRRMKISSIVDVMQDLTCAQSDTLGVGWEPLMKRQRGWLLNSWQIIFDRYPGEGERYVGETRPWKFEKFFGYRNFALTDAAGEYLVRANSIWFYVNTEKMRPAIPEEDILAAYKLDEPIPMDYAKSRKLSIPADLEERESFTVRRSDLDYNHHMNNGQYIRLALEYFPADHEIAELRVEYRNAAKYGDRILPKVGVDEEGWITVVMSSMNGDIYAILKGMLR